MRVTDADAELGIVDGRIGITAEGEASVYLDVPEHQPLTAGETHATLRVSGDDYRVSLDLDADGLDALQEALTDARGEEA